MFSVESRLDIERPGVRFVLEYGQDPEKVSLSDGAFCVRDRHLFDMII